MRNITNISRFITNTTSNCINGNSISIFRGSKSVGLSNSGCGCGGTVKK